MHGYTRRPYEPFHRLQAHTGSFEAAVLGRSRGGWYLALSQADVLAVIDYIEAHWNIDANRIHITGGSMGGGGTLTLGSRFPHRFASGQVTCGYVGQNQINNLLTFPIYATHSSDDPVVPPLLIRGPMADLRRRGGQVIFDETNGFGHAVWGYAAGNKRSGEWAEQQVRPDSRTVRHLDFTALDGAAMRCWWAEIAEWGAEPRPARFHRHGRREQPAICRTGQCGAASAACDGVAFRFKTAVARVCQRRCAARDSGSAACGNRD